MTLVFTDTTIYEHFCKNSRKVSTCSEKEKTTDVIYDFARTVSDRETEKENNTIHLKQTNKHISLQQIKITFSMRKKR